jgi:hypothetical protein
VDIQGEAIPRPSSSDAQNQREQSEIARRAVDAATPDLEANGPMCESRFTLFTDEILILLWLTSRENWQSPCSLSGHNAVPAQSNSGVA